jgi:hypothetical protein
MRIVNKNKTGRNIPSGRTKSIHIMSIKFNSIFLQRNEIWGMDFFGILRIAIEIKLKNTVTLISKSIIKIYLVKSLKKIDGQ